MSPGRAARLAGLRARLARNASQMQGPVTDELARPAYDPAMGLPIPVIEEALPPTPVPDGLRGVYQQCGRCESYIPPGALLCVRPGCIKSEELHPATHGPVVRDVDPVYAYPQPRREG